MDNKYFVNHIFSNFGVVADILSFIWFCFLLSKPKIFTDGCYQDLIDNWSLSPITDIYLSYEKTPDSLKLGYLEEFSNDNIEIKSSEIFKWKNKYINIKRNPDSSPINFLEISESPLLNVRFNYQTLQFDNNNYLHYSTEDKNGENLYDLEISFRENPYPNKKKFTNICFSKSCQVNNGTCLNNNNYIKIDEDGTYNFINYNNLQINPKNYIDYYLPEKYYLFKRSQIPDSHMKKQLKTIKTIFLIYLIVNIPLRLMKLIFACFLKIGTKCCSCLNFIFLIPPTVNLALISSIMALSPNNGNENSGQYIYYTIGLSFPSGLIYILLIFDTTNLGYALFHLFQPFSIEPEYICSYCGCGNEKDNDIYAGKNKKSEIKKNIKEIKSEIKKTEQERENLEKSLEKIVYEIRKLNAYNETNVLNLFIKRKYQLKIKTYNEIDKEIEELKDKLNKRKEKLQEMKKSFDDSEKKNYFFYGNKIKLNIIYLDENINAFEDFSPSYEFFKFLKNSVDGVFFGIKNEEDFHFIQVQLPEEFKFVLIYATNNKNKAKDFLESYHSKFSDILIFTFDENEFDNLEEYKNIISIESNYISLLSKLSKLERQYDEKLINDFKPYNLNLYSDYNLNNQIKKCHLELLNNTLLSKNINNINNREFKDGLNNSQYLDFISFLDNLDDGENKTQTDEKKEFIINRDLILERERERERKNDNDFCDIRIEPKNKNRYELRMNNNNEDSIDINVVEEIPDINTIERIKIGVRENIQESENDLLRKKNNRDNNIPRIISVRPIIKKEYLGKIKKNEKELIKSFLLNNYNKSELLVKLYTLNNENFYNYLNSWLRTFNLKIYQNIGPLVGKILNFLYYIMKEEKKINQRPKKLYRALVIKKADIFLYKACEGDIFFYPSFTSTTSNPDVTNIFKINENIEMKQLNEKCNCLIEFKYNLEQNDVLQEANIAKYSKFGNEAERLFPPYSFFKINKVTFNVGNRFGKHIPDKEIFDGTFEHPFKIEAEIIKRNFYLDSAIVNEQKFNYNKKENRWELN